MKDKSKKEIALQTAKEILEFAIKTSKDDLEMAERQAQLARRILMKFNLKPGYEFKRFFCHKCKRFIVPGINARIRINSKRKALTTTCMSCGYVNRKILRKLK